MGDRCSMEIHFGGQLKRELLQDFIETLTQGLADVLEVARWWRRTELPPFEIVD